MQKMSLDLNLTLYIRIGGKMDQRFKCKVIKPLEENRENLHELGLGGVPSCDIESTIHKRMKSQIDFIKITNFTKDNVKRMGTEDKN